MSDNKKWYLEWLDRLETTPTSFSDIVRGKTSRLNEILIEKPSLSDESLKEATFINILTGKKYSFLEGADDYIVLYEIGNSKKQYVYAGFTVGEIFKESESKLIVPLNYYTEHQAEIEQLVDEIARETLKIYMEKKIKEGERLRRQVKAAQLEAQKAESLLNLFREKETTAERKVQELGKIEGQNPDPEGEENPEIRSMRWK